MQIDKELYLELLSIASTMVKSFKSEYALEDEDFMYCCFSDEMLALVSEFNDLEFKIEQLKSLREVA